MILANLLFISLASFVALLLIPKNKIRLLKYVGCLATFGMVFVSLFLWLFFDKMNPKYQFKFMLTPECGYDIIFGIDGISLTFILLTTLIIPLCVLAAWESIGDRNIKKFLSYLLYIELCLLLTFSTLDLIVFFISFESILIPMSLIILLGGSQLRRIRATLYFFLYTFLGSLFLLYAIFSIYMVTGTGNFLVISLTDFSPDQQKVLWICFFIAFAVKVPMYPFHVWLPEAHVEAPTIGSVILAALLLKLGGYGFIRFVFTMLPDTSNYFQPLMATICIIGILYASLIAVIQLDIKRIIAYASIAHMNYSILGLATFTTAGINGSILLMIAHGLVSAGLFFLVGVLYDRHHDRNLMYFSGLVQVIPLYSILFFFFTLANISFPGTFNFIGEFLILIGLVHLNNVMAFITILTLIVGIVYSFLLFNKIIFGDLKIAYATKFTDLTRHEMSYLLPLLIITLFFGFYPNLIMQLIDLNVAAHISYLVPSISMEYDLATTVSNNYIINSGETELYVNIMKECLTYVPDGGPFNSHSLSYDHTKYTQMMTDSELYMKVMKECLTYVKDGGPMNGYSLHYDHAKYTQMMVDAKSSK